MKKFLLIIALITGLTDYGATRWVGWYHVDGLLGVCNSNRERVTVNLGAIYVESYTMQIWYWAWLKPGECKWFKYKRPYVPYLDDGRLVMPKDAI